MLATDEELRVADAYEVLLLIEWLEQMNGLYGDES
jgi:hypothetical protein